MTAPVTYPDAAPNGLASMLGGLIESNLAAHPERERLLAKPATYAVTAPDAGVSVSIRLAPDGVIVRNGVIGKPNLHIETGSENLIGLSAVPLRFGLPDATTKDGRDVNRKLFKGELKVRGMWLHPGKLARLNKLLSVL